MENSPAENRNIRAYLKSLLLERIAQPERKEEIDRQIKQRFEKEVAILVIDYAASLAQPSNTALSISWQ